MKQIKFSDKTSFEDVFFDISNYIENCKTLSDEVVTARSDFFSLTGKLNETDQSFTNRMNAFLLWFVFDWRCRTTWKSPFEMYREKKCKDSDENRAFFECLGFENQIHSLFEKKRISDQEAVVSDLMTKEKYIIQKPDFLLGSPKGTYFETRIFNLNGSYRFSNYFIQHPLEVKKDVKKKCRSIQKQRESVKPFLILLHYYHTKWERYRNININNIYHFDKSIPEAK